MRVEEREGRERTNLWLLFRATVVNLSDLIDHWLVTADLEVRKTRGHREIIEQLEGQQWSVATLTLSNKIALGRI